MTDHETNLAIQKKVAIRFVAMQGGVEEIRFTQEGGKPGLGASWRADAVVTIDGVEYRETLGPSILSGDSLPDIPPSAHNQTTVIFSDGTRDLIE